VIDQRFDRQDVLGGDFATTAGPWGLRAEAAYSWARASDAGDPFALRSSFFLVAGTDRTFFEHLNVNLQYVLHDTVGYSDPRAQSDPVTQLIATRGALLQNELRRLQQGYSVRVSYGWLDDTLSTELALVGYLTDGGGAVRPKIVYHISDSYQLILGGDVIYGPSLSYYGQFKRNTTVYTELRFGFP
jgi:hypothetical protein